MRILLTGGTGLIGQALGKALVQEGYQLTVVTRHRSRAQVDYPCDWIEADLTQEMISLDEVQGVIHLAGESIAHRWTQKNKNKILQSRIVSTKNLLASITQQKNISFFIGASAIGYYGDRKGEVLTESSAAGKGFLSEVVQAWEKSTLEWMPPRVRPIIFRFGLVLSDKGGALPQMLKPFRWGLGGKMGGGEQWMSWIHIDDVVSLILWSIQNQFAHGIYNAVAPQPIQNKDFVQLVAQFYSGWHVFSAPTLALRLALGEMSDLLLQSQRVSAEKVLASHFQYQYSTMESALNQLLPSSE